VLQAEAIATRCENALAEVEDATTGRMPVRVFCPIWRNPYMTINRDTFVNDMLRACGGENIFLGRPERYPAVTLEEMAALKPDVILLPDEPFPFGEKHVAEFRALERVPAVRAGRLHLLDGRVLSWYGPRIADSLRTLARILLARR
jgi:ABC-type Fe3+-hydroxamate transport system substrate-binding protein